MQLNTDGVEFSAKDRKKKIRVPTQTSIDLAYFCGILAGDGSIYTRAKKFDNIIKCVGNPRSEQGLYTDVLAPLMRRLFNFVPIMKVQDSGTTFGFCIYSKAMYSFFTRTIGMPSGKKYDKLCIPPVFKQELSQCFAFIRGVADTDFYVKLVKKNYPVIVGVSKSESFLKEMGEYLRREGFTYNMYCRVQHDKRLKVPKTIYVYELNFSGRRNLQLWMEKIGFSSPKHLARIRLYEQTQINNTSYDG